MKMRVVLDANVVFEGLIKKNGACGLIIDAWFLNHIQVHISNALLHEYLDVLSRKLGKAKWDRARNTLHVLLTGSEFTKIYYSWRPSSPDPGDEHVIDCAMNANAILVTNNLKDFRFAQENLGLTVLSPVQFLTVFAEI